MTVLDALRRILTPRAGGPPAAMEAPSGPRAPDAFGFSGRPGEDALRSMTPDELLAWENRDAPSSQRVSDEPEARTDERQDRTTGLNFPLHWTSADQSWNYLFDFAIASNLLDPRPDDRVLDFAAGTCWATELLGRLGVRTVSIDLSVEMMRRGRERLATDARLLFRGEAGFVAARGQALPFRDGSFDGVLCMNALHHLPSYAEGLREIYRVLRPGGRAVFSEPGSAHAVQPLSKFRMDQEQVIEKAVSLPLIRQLAFDAGFTRMRVVPLRSSDAYVFEYAAAPADAPALSQMWDETLRLSPTEHARFVLSKGDDPPADTLLPANRLIGRLQAHIDLEQVTLNVRHGEAFTDRLRVTNAGSVTWKARGRRFGGQVTCGLKVCDAAGEIIREDLGRTPLPRDVAPGETIDLNVTVTGELPQGEYRLRYDMVVEGVTWFEFQGSPCAWRALTVAR